MKTPAKSILFFSLFTLILCTLLPAMEITKRQVISVNHPLIRFNGRVHFTDQISAVMAYPGISVEMQFKGSEIGFKGSIIKGEASYFNAYLDGKTLERIVLKSGNFDHTIATGLDPEKIHTLRLIRRNESWQGIVEIKAFVADIHLKLEELGPEPLRRIMCIGDSITSGEQTEYLPPHGVPGIHNSNSEIAYGYLLAKYFEAQVHIVSYGGRGLIRNWEGRRDEVTAPQFFERTLPDDPGSVWDHTLYQPDLVTICLGANDFSKDILEESEYVLVYVKFIERILEVYPKAKILLISSPVFGIELLSDTPSRREALEAYIESAAEKVNQNVGKTKVKSHHIGYYPGSEWNAHPNAPQHQAMARELEPVIAEWLHWNK